MTFQRNYNGQQGKSKAWEDAEKPLHTTCCCSEKHSMELWDLLGTFNYWRKVQTHTSWSSFVFFCFVSSCYAAINMSLFWKLHFLLVSLESQILIGEKLYFESKRCEWYEGLVKKFTSLHFITLDKEGVAWMNWHKFFPVL